MKNKLAFVLVLITFFVVGLLIGQESNSETSKDGQIVGLNHVGIRVPDFESALDFYQNTLGFQLIYRFNNDDGSLMFAYFQISKSTFIELLPANEEHPPGIDHFGLEIKEMDSVVTHFRDSDIRVADPYVSPYTRVNLAHARDSDGVYFELIEAVDGSDLQRAMQNWQHK